MLTVVGGHPRLQRVSRPASEGDMIRRGAERKSRPVRKKIESMKRIVRLGGPKCWRSAFAIFVLCATAVALPAQTFPRCTSSMARTDPSPQLHPSSRPPMEISTGRRIAGGVNYGRARSNCSSPPNSDGCGMVFEISPSGTLTTLHSFCAHIKAGEPCKDGFLPRGDRSGH